MGPSMFLAAAIAAAPVEPVPLDHFVKHPQFLDVKISPTGEYLAASVLATEDTGALVIMRRADLAVTGSMKLAGKTFVNDFTWVNDERLVLTVARRESILGTPTPTGDLFATNWDGKRQDLLIGVNRDSSSAPRTQSRFTYATLIDPLAGDDKHMLVQVFGLDVLDSDSASSTIERVDVYSGKRKVVARSPVRAAEFRTDATGAVRYAQGIGIDTTSKLYFRDGTEWRLVNNEASSDQKVQAVGIARDGRRAIVRSSEAQGPDGLYAWDPNGSEFTPVFRHRVVDPYSFVYDYTGMTPVGAYYMDGRPTLEVLDPEAPEIKLLRTLAKSFPDEWVVPRSWSRDGRLLVFSVESDRNPGTYYLFDRDARQATFLLAARPWIEPGRMAEMEPIELVARDGVTVHGFVTTPPGRSDKLPTIVIPFGTAFGGFQRWGFDAEAQLLASRGYAVLHVNYRGTENYGDSYLELGYRQWGGKMQDDVTDATRWAIAQGIADPARICIYGVDYGGYAAVMGAAKEPALYRCAIGAFGYYDLALLFKAHAQPLEGDTIRNLYAKAVGTGRENLRQRSPIALADRITAPVMLVLGTLDIFAPPGHARAMREALTKAGRPPEWLEVRDEGHGFSKEANNRELYTRMLAFLDKHIGNGRAEAVAAGE